MPHANRESAETERASRPALPPFAGGIRPRLPSSHPLRRTGARGGAGRAGRETIPPFFMPTVVVGGPLPGAREQPPAPVLASNLALEEQMGEPSVEAAETSGNATASAGIAYPIDMGTPQVLDAVSPPEQLEAWVGDTSEMPTAPLREDELTHETQAAASPVIDSEQMLLEEGVQTRGTTAYPGADETELAAGQAEVAGADLFDEPFEQDARRPGLLPPSFFQGPLPETAGPRNNENADDLRDLFIDAYAYDSQPSGEVVDPRFLVPSPPPPPDRTTPIFGMPSITPPRPLRATRPSGGYRPRTSGGTNIRRVTPVLSRAITPISTPVIPLHPGTPYAPAAMSPTPASVPVLVDYQSSRAVVHALEMVASQIRIGHLVVVGDVPDGDDMASLAAGLAAALAALLGVRD